MLYTYVGKNDIQKVKRILTKGGDPNRTNWGDRTVEYAIFRTHFKVADLLLENGGKINTSHDKGNIIFRAIAASEQPKDCTTNKRTIQYLVKKGYKISDAENKKSGDNILRLIAMKQGSDCVSLAKYIIQNGGKHFLNELIPSPSGSEASVSPYQAIYRDGGSISGSINYDMAILFIKEGLNINDYVYTSRRRDLTALDLAVLYGNVQVAKLLVQKGVQGIDFAIEQNPKLGKGTKVKEYLILR